MDGNGRWAKSRGLSRIEGHRAGAASVRSVVEEARRMGIQYLTLFSFSLENWGRPQDEVSGLMELFVQHLESERDGLLKNGIRLTAVGDLERLPERVRNLLSRGIGETADNSSMTLVLALSYGSRQEIAHAAQRLSEKVQRGEMTPDQITPESFAGELWTAGIPDPDLLIRTSGEMRISNFLLFQLAYAELVVVDDLWPDFDGQKFHECVDEYLRRERRFGLTTEQLEMSGRP
ncbi:MAG: di-trans,poly-cis-decaprenylcistransferase [Deltaproteobacteria bacterium]|nr:di-trans,poly-cis-decaprenylcistransferase [Deltaproteobacteria bacterium]